MSSIFKDIECNGGEHDWKLVAEDTHEKCHICTICEMKRVTHNLRIVGDKPKYVFMKNGLILARIEEGPEVMTNGKYSYIR